MDWTCFVAGTPTTLADGSTKAIELVKVGDVVKAFDEQTDEFVNGRVERTFKKQSSSLIQISLQNGESIKATEEHPFYIKGKWLAAKELQQGFKIKAINGFIEVLSTNQIKEQTEVFNFEVQKYHTYLVGSSGLVVHNDCLVQLKDGTQKVVSLDETHRLYSEGRLDRILDANVPAENNTNNPLNKAWQKAKNGNFDPTGISYSDADFIEFINSKDGYAFSQKYADFAIGTNLNAALWAAGEGVSSFIKWIRNAETGLERFNPRFGINVSGENLVQRSLSNPNSLVGATIQEIESLIPNGWIKLPLRRGEGVRYLNPSKPGEAVMIEKGWTNADSNNLHSGPYVRISINGKTTRIPLMGNPILR